MKLEDRDFIRLRDFMYQNYGVKLDNKQTMVEGRLAAMLMQKGYDSFGAYVEDLMRDSSGTMAGELVTKLTTNYTYFLREETHYHFLEKVALPEWSRKIRDHDLRIWSAGCSSGEEAYTTAMVLDEFFGLEKSRWDSTILATDISTKVLSLAKAGVYPVENLERLPERWKKKYFVPSGADQWAVSENLKKEVVFGQFNLMGNFSRFRKKFHVIFCRNVMIYFDLQTKKELTQKFFDVLEPGGYFFIGMSETVTGINERFQQIAPAIYRKGS